MYVLPAVMATGDEKFTCCQPDSVSLVNVALANRAPSAVHKFPMCVPVFAADLKNRTALMKPSISVRNLIPASAAPLSGQSLNAGVAVAGQMVHGQVRSETATETALDGAPRL